MTEARLVALSLEGGLDVVILDGPLMHDGSQSGSTKALAVKEALGIEPETPLMAALAQRREVALVRETEEEWECVIPHSLLPLLMSKERGLAVFERHPLMPITRRWRREVHEEGGGGEVGGEKAAAGIGAGTGAVGSWEPWYDESAIDAGLLPDLEPDLDLDLGVPANRNPTAAPLPGPPSTPAAASPSSGLRLGLPEPNAALHPPWTRAKCGTGAQASHKTKFKTSHDA